MLHWANPRKQMEGIQKMMTTSSPAEARYVKLEIQSMIKSASVNLELDYLFMLREKKFIQSERWVENSQTCISGPAAI